MEVPTFAWLIKTQLQSLDRSYPFKNIIIELALPELYQRLFDLHRLIYDAFSCS